MAGAQSDRRLLASMRMKLCFLTSTVPLDRETKLSFAPWPAGCECWIMGCFTRALPHHLKVHPAAAEREEPPSTEKAFSVQGRSLRRRPPRRKKMHFRTSHQ